MSNADLMNGVLARAGSDVRVQPDDPIPTGLIAALEALLSRLERLEEKAAEPKPRR
jgi:hypothetical protein